jgi:hypothetical protein
VAIELNETTASLKPKASRTELSNFHPTLLFPLAPRVEGRELNEPEPEFVSHRIRDPSLSGERA